MIKIKNLTKIYKSKNKEQCVAIDNISLTLEDKGFVFIVGKSGSGKTTLLGLLGGLDNISSGDITINGNSFKKFKYHDFVSYRNQMIGYIFQDFHLIDELTIEENIALSLDLQNVKYKEEINKALESVDLAGYNMRYPKELSGGEKQRVAIARALVKNPMIILADEPTGNLDSKTTTQVLELLKKLSKERLVLMVSHNLNDANRYADRIIELSHGKIINDLVRNPNYCYDVTINDEMLILPINKKISLEEHELINSELQKGTIKHIFQTEDVFIPNTISYEESDEKTKLKHKNFNIGKLFKLAFTFLKKDFVKLFIYSFVVAALIVILGLCQLIVNFNSADVIEKELHKLNQTTVSLTKVEPKIKDMVDYDTTRIIDIKEKDIKAFYNAGYEGEIYELLNVVLDYGPNMSLSHYHMKSILQPALKYQPGTRGVLVTTEEYVSSIYAEVDYIIRANEEKDYGIYITDYTADAIITYSPHLFRTYEDILGHHKSTGSSCYAYINGIIKTGYNEKYQDVISVLDDTSTTREEIQEFMQNEHFLAFYDDIIQNYSVAYSFNPNFKDDFVKSNSKTWVPMGYSIFEVNGIPYQTLDLWVQNCEQDNYVSLKDNEIVMHVDSYNAIFNTNYQVTNINEFVPHEITYTYYHYYDKDRTTKVDTMKLKIVGLSTVRNFASREVMEKIIEHNTMTTGLYFSNTSDMSIILNTANKKGFEPNSVIASSLQTMTKAVSVFSEFFVIILVGLCICSFIVLFNYGLKLVQERKYEIGILKALGIKDFDLTIIFGLQMLLLILLVITMYILGSVIFIDLANRILVNSLLELAPNRFLMDINVLFINGQFLLENSLLVILIALLSFIIPLFKLKFLKPTNIIKAKE